MSRQATRARNDAPFMEQFIQAHEPFILRTAAAQAGRTVTRSDDEYSIALMAFYEAVRSYDAAVGPFGPYASLVIGRRLTDYYRSVRRFDAEISLAPQTFDGEIDENQPDALIQLAVAGKMAESDLSGQSGTVSEIETANLQFIEYGFSFYDLTGCSPRAAKTRRACKKAVHILRETPALLNELHRTHSLPIKALSEQSGIPKKVIERHRKYIIAAALLLEGEYPVLSGYLRAIKD